MWTQKKDSYLYIVIDNISRTNKELFLLSSTMKYNMWGTRIERMSLCLSSYFYSKTTENMWEWEYVRNSTRTKENVKNISKNLFIIYYI